KPRFVKVEQAILIGVAIVETVRLRVNRDRREIVGSTVHWNVWCRAGRTVVIDQRRNRQRIKWPGWTGVGDLIRVGNLSWNGDNSTVSDLGDIDGGRRIRDRQRLAIAIDWVIERIARVMGLKRVVPRLQSSLATGWVGHIQRIDIGHQGYGTCCC